MELEPRNYTFFFKYSSLEGTIRVDGRDADLHPISESYKRRRGRPLLFDVRVRQSCIYAMPVVICNIIFLLVILSGSPPSTCLSVFCKAGKTREITCLRTSFSVVSDVVGQRLFRRYEHCLLHGYLAFWLYDHIL